MLIYDNFLEESTFNQLKEIMTSAVFPWYYNDRITTSKEKANDLRNYQFTHSFFRDDSPSESYDLILPIIHRIKLNKVIRAKANLNPFSGNDYYCTGAHLDSPFEKVNVAIFYVTTNNGYSLVDDKKVESIENRLILFEDCDHSAFLQTDSKNRIVININYI